MIEPKTGSPFMVNRPTILSGLEGAKIHNREETQRLLAHRSISGESDIQMGQLLESNRNIENALRGQAHYHFESERIVKKQGNYSTIYWNRKIKGLN
jgi:hypothetical protein